VISNRVVAPAERAISADTSTSGRLLQPLLREPRERSDAPDAISRINKAIAAPIQPR